jgi:methionine biosynthesis protein MetW
MKPISSPDQSARGLLADSPDALRYDNVTDDPYEVSGLIRSLMPAGVRVLDVGCGTGSVTLLANQGKGNEILCIEPDEERCRLAKARGLQAHNEVLSPEFFETHGAFDVIVFADVLEHLPSPAEILELAVRGLRPGGIVIVSVPNVAHWSVRLSLLFGKFEYTDVGILDSTHLRWFTERSLRSFVRSCGLEIEAIRHTAGATLPVYYDTFPLRFVPGRIKRPVVRFLTRLLPRLFACQHILVGRKRS